MSNSSVSVNDMASDGNHMIFQSILRDDFASVRGYLDVGVDPNIRGFMGQTPAISAAAANAWRMVELLAENGADLSLESSNGRSVASIAQQRIDMGSVRLESPDGQAFVRVQEILQARGLL